MGVFDLFSKREARARGRAPDVLQHDVLPDEFRVQVVQIWLATIGPSHGYYEDGAVILYERIVKILC